MANDQKAQLGVRVAIIGSFIYLSIAPILAATVPLPKSRTEINRHFNESLTNSPATVTVPAQALRAFAQAAPATRPPPSPIFNPFAPLLGKPKSNVTLNAEQRGLVEKINAYLSGTRILSGNFIQVGPDGSRTKGDFFIAKPGKLRFEYSDPSPIELIADGQSVVVRDRNLATQDVYPLSQTPLRFLLSNHVDLLNDTNFIAVSADDTFITAVVEEDNGLVGKSRLVIMFSAKDMQLKQWTVTDPQGYDTTVAVSNLDTSKKPDPSLFKIDYTNYHN